MAFPKALRRKTDTNTCTELLESVLQSQKRTELQLQQTPQLMERPLSTASTEGAFTNLYNGRNYRQCKHHTPPCDHHPVDSKVSKLETIGYGNKITRQDSHVDEDLHSKTWAAQALQVMPVPQRIGPKELKLVTALNNQGLKSCND